MHEEEDTCMSYEEEDTCMSYEEEDTCVLAWPQVERALDSTEPVCGKRYGLVYFITQGVGAECLCGRESLLN